MKAGLAGTVTLTRRPDATLTLPAWLRVESELREVIKGLTVPRSGGLFYVCRLLRPMVLILPDNSTLQTFRKGKPRCRGQEVSATPPEGQATRKSAQRESH